MGVRCLGWHGEKKNPENQKICFCESGEAQHVPEMLTAVPLLQLQGITLHIAQGCWANSPLLLKLKKKKKTSTKVPLLLLDFQQNFFFSDKSALLLYVKFKKNLNRD